MEFSLNSTTMLEECQTFLEKDYGELFAGRTAKEVQDKCKMVTSKEAKKENVPE